MADILIRDVPQKTKLLLEERAAHNGRSRNSELLAILEETLAPKQRTWLGILRKTAHDVEGADDIELEHPIWADSHDITFE